MSIEELMYHPMLFDITKSIFEIKTGKDYDVQQASWNQHTWKVSVDLAIRLLQKYRVEKK